MSDDVAAPLPVQPGAEAIPREYQAGAAAQFAALCAQARLVDEFPLPDQLEPASVFIP